MNKIKTWMWVALIVVVIGIIGGSGTADTDIQENNDDINNRSEQQQVVNNPIQETDEELEQIIESGEEIERRISKSKCTFKYTSLFKFTLCCY